MGHGVHACLVSLELAPPPTPLLANTDKDSASHTERRRLGEVAIMSVLGVSWNFGGDVRASPHW